MTTNMEIPIRQQNSYIWDEVHQKTYKFHQQLRNKYIEEHKARIRKQYSCMHNLSRLLAEMPQEMEDALNWSRQVVDQIGKSKNYQFPFQKIIQLFKIIQKFPCIQTITLLHSVSHKITFHAIHELFQYDISGLLQKLITCPQKIVPRRIWTHMDQTQADRMHLQITKMSMCVLAALCEQSEKAKNFLVMNHKSFTCISRAFSRIGHQVQYQFILCLYSFTRHQLTYDEQFTRVIRAVQRLFCHNFQDLQFIQIKLVIKSLTAVVKSKQKWALDLIEDVGQYDILDKFLQVLRGCNTKAIQQATYDVKSSSMEEFKYKDIDKLRQIGEIVHLINLFFIYYIEITTNQYLNWESFFTQFFTILSIEGSFYQNARRDVYFIFNNIICEAEQPDTSYHLLRSMIFQHKCIHVFAKCLQKQINQDIIQELSNCIVSLFMFKNVEFLAHDITNSGLIKFCVETITRNFYCANDIAKENLIVGLIHLLDRTHDQNIKQAYVYQIKCFESKLQQMSAYWKKIQIKSQQLIDKLLYQLSKYN